MWAFYDRSTENNISTWSLRDISKIFLRLRNQIRFKAEFKNIGTPVNLLLNALSSVFESSPEEKSKKDELASKLIELLKKIFKENSKVETLKQILNEKPTLDKQEKEKKIYYYIHKDNTKILLKVIRKSDKNNKKSLLKWKTA